MNPFELADYVGAGAALLVGILVGRRMRPRPPEPMQPMCSCDHGYGHHEGGKRCAGYESNYRNGEDHRERCECRLYDGPDPTIFGLDGSR